MDFLTTAAVLEESNLIQDDNFGKIIFFDLNVNIKCFQKSQKSSGLFINEDNVILATEHGPYGGDEINKTPENYGWPSLHMEKIMALERYYLKKRNLNCKKTIV